LSQHLHFSKEGTELINYIGSYGPTYSDSPKGQDRDFFRGKNELEALDQFSKTRQLDHTDFMRYTQAIYIKTDHNQEMVELLNKAASDQVVSTYKLLGASCLDVPMDILRANGKGSTMPFCSPFVPNSNVGYDLFAGAREVWNAMPNVRFKEFAKIPGAVNFSGQLAASMIRVKLWLSPANTGPKFR
jgi:hypothetical protein